MPEASMRNDRADPVTVAGVTPSSFPETLQFLMRHGLVDSRRNPDVFEGVLKYAEGLARHVVPLGGEVVLSKDQGVAVLRAADPEAFPSARAEDREAQSLSEPAADRDGGADEGSHASSAVRIDTRSIPESEIPPSGESLFAHARLYYWQSCAILVFRGFLENESGQGGEELWVPHADVLSAIRTCYGETGQGSEADVTRRIQRILTRLLNMGLVECRGEPPEAAWRGSAYLHIAVRQDDVEAFSRMVLDRIEALHDAQAREAVGSMLPWSAKTAPSDSPDDLRAPGAGIAQTTEHDPDSSGRRDQSEGGET